MGGGKPYRGSWSTDSIPTAAQPQRAAVLQMDTLLLNPPQTHTKSNLLCLSSPGGGLCLLPGINQYKKT